MIKLCPALSLAAVALAFAGASALPAPLPDWLRAERALPEVTLDPLYRGICRRPAEHLGYSFGEDFENLSLMAADGANAVGEGTVWRPIRDPAAPNGVGVRVPDLYRGAAALGQTFTADNAFTALSIATPTFTHPVGGSATVTLYRAGEHDRRQERVASQRFEKVADNAWQRLEFAPQPPGNYYWECSDAVGPIGVWGRTGDPYPRGVGWRNDRPIADTDFETRLTTPDRDQITVIGDAGERAASRLGRGRLGDLEALGMRASVHVGNWNNGFFPYYPRWFYELFPDVTMLDQHGRPFEAGMFGESFGWPAIDHPVITEGTARYIDACVREFAPSPAVIYWVMGGEALYPTYAWADRWSDYQDNAVVHFRHWLRRKYGDVGAVSRAWRSDHRDFAEIDPPRAPETGARWADWLDYRCDAMAERFQYHYQAARAADPSRLIVTANHGRVYSGQLRTTMGFDPVRYAQVSNGFETGQIIRDEDPDLFNLIYGESLASLGKPYCPVRLAYKFGDPEARGGGRSYTPEAARRYVYESLGLGAWHLGLIQWRGSLPDGEWGVMGTPAQAEIADLFAECAAMAPLLMHAWPLKPQVGVFLSDETWLVDGFDRRWTALHKWLSRSHIPKHYVYDWHFENGRAASYPLVISIGNRRVSAEVLPHLEAYLRAGGHLLVVGDFAAANRASPAASSSSPAWLRPGRLGRGTITIVPGEKLGPALPAITEAVAAVPGARRVTVRSRGDRRASFFDTVDVTGDAHDTPDDMSEHASLGQTVTVDKGFVRSFAICTPTYWKQPKEFGFTLEVRAGGPEGEVIKRAHIAPETISDNGWCEIVVDRRGEPGARYYVAALPDPGLPANTIGWWRLSGGAYPEGTAYADGEPIEGVRQVRIRTREDRPADANVETFALSDGLNVLALAVNIGDEPLEVDLSFDATALMPGVRYRMCDAITGEPLKAAGAERTVRLRLERHGTAAVWLEAPVDADVARAARDAIAPGVARFKALGALTPFQQALWEDLQAAAERPAKVAALAVQLRSQMGIGIVRRDLRDGRLTLDLRLIGLDGIPVTGAAVAATVVPAFGFTRELAELGEGRYRLTLSADELPRRYDYQRRQYRTFWGAFDLDIVAVQGTRSASLTVRGSAF